jgi:hypothetical protein
VSSRPSVEVLLKPYKNKEYFTWICFDICNNILFLLRMKNILKKSCTENKNTFFVQYSFLKNRAVNEIKQRSHK